MTELALYQIETELYGLLQLREQMVQDGELPEALAVVDKQIEAYCSAEVAKVDRIAGAIRACERNMMAAAKEAERLDARFKAWRSRMEFIKAATLRAMQARGIKSLETPENKLTVCGNGGVEPLEFTGEALPQEYCKITVTMELRQWKALLDDADLKGIVGATSAIIPDNAAIRAALKRGESVPGAKLKERGSHLKLS
jgi:hypothetical protein